MEKLTQGVSRILWVTLSGLACLLGSLSLFVLLWRFSRRPRASSGLQTTTPAPAAPETRLEDLELKVEDLEHKLMTLPARMGRQEKRAAAPAPPEEVPQSPPFGDGIEEPSEVAARLFGR